MKAKKLLKPLKNLKGVISPKNGKGIMELVHPMSPKIDTSGIPNLGLNSMHKTFFQPPKTTLHNPDHVHFFTKPTKKKELDSDFRRDFTRYKISEQKMVKNLGQKYRSKKIRQKRRELLSKSVV